MQLYNLIDLLEMYFVKVFHSLREYYNFIYRVYIMYNILLKQYLSLSVQFESGLQAS